MKNFAADANNTLIYLLASNKYFRARAAIDFHIKRTTYTLLHFHVDQWLSPAREVICNRDVEI